MVIKPLLKMTNWEKGGVKNELNQTLAMGFRECHGHFVKISAQNVK